MEKNLEFLHNKLTKKIRRMSGEISGLILEKALTFLKKSEEILEEMPEESYFIFGSKKDSEAIIKWILGTNEISKEIPKKKSEEMFIVLLESPFS